MKIKKRIIVTSISDSRAPVSIGDVLYLSSKPVSRQLLGKFAKQIHGAEWFRKAVGTRGLHPVDVVSSNAGWLSLEMLHIAMQRMGRIEPRPSNAGPFWLLGPDRAPTWFAHLPHWARAHLWREFAVSDGVDPLAILLQFPHMGFGYIVADDTLASDAARVFNLCRLGRIKQLGFVHDPVLRGVDRGLSSLMYDHTRYCHSLDTLATANLIANNVGLRHELRLTLALAAETHDALTPAGGDSVKLIDPPAFDEDAHYHELLVGSEWEALRERHGIDERLLVSTVRGKGLLGRILDTADKTSYVARDTWHYLGCGAPKKRYDDTGFCAIAGLVAEDPHICALWESARVVQGRLAFANVARLERFLVLRALMFRELYYNPWSRFFEYLIGKGVMRHLYKTGVVTRADLLTHTDEWVSEHVDRVLGVPNFLTLFHKLQDTRVEECADMESARRRAAELDADDAVLAVVDDFKPTTNTATNKFFVSRGYEIARFSDVCVEATEQIGRILTAQRTVRLFIFVADDLRIPREKRRMLKQILRET